MILSGILGSILKQVGGDLINNIIDKGSNLFQAYLNKEISKEELRTRLLETMLKSTTEIEKAHAESLTSTFNTFITAAATNPTLARGWAVVLYSQLFVLVWHQWCIPFIVFMGWVEKYPSSGTTTDWAYALIAFCLGGGSVLLRTSAKLDLSGLKSVVGIK